MSDHQKKIRELLHEAETCQNPQRLQKIVEELEEWGAWNAAAAARNRQHEVERAYAESVWK